MHSFREFLHVNDTLMHAVDLLSIELIFIFSPGLRYVHTVYMVLVVTRKMAFDFNWFVTSAGS